MRRLCQMALAYREGEGPVNSGAAAQIAIQNAQVRALEPVYAEAASCRQSDRVNVMDLHRRRR